LDGALFEGKLLKINGSYWRVDDSDSITTDLWVTTTVVFLRTVWVNRIALYQVKENEDDGDGDEIDVRPATQFDIEELREEERRDYGYDDDDDDEYP